MNKGNHLFLAINPMPCIMWPRNRYSSKLVCNGISKIAIMANGMNLTRLKFNSYFSGEKKISTPVKIMVTPAQSPKANKIRFQSIFLRDVVNEVMDC